MLSKGFDQGRGLNLPATRWYRSLPAAGLHRPEALGPARYWLQVPGSFTRALKQQCQLDFQVDVCREGFGRPSREEANTLNLANRQLAWIREVRLVGDGRPWVLARTVIPLDCLQGRAGPCVTWVTNRWEPSCSAAGNGSVASWKPVSPCNRIMANRAWPGALCSIASTIG